MIFVIGAISYYVVNNCLNKVGSGEGEILQLCSRAPKLMTFWAPRVGDLLDMPLKPVAFSSQNLGSNDSFTIIENNSGF